MGEFKVDITSAFAEKGVDLVGGVFEKITGQAFTEIGSILGEKLTLPRLENQFKILAKAQKIAESHNYTLKQINLKKLVPLLNLSSLEDDETLQNKWSNLLINFSTQNEKYESSIFPYLLNQISRNEALELDRLIDEKEITNKSIKLNNIELSNLVRLGLLERIIFDGVFFDSNELIYYKVSEIGKAFISCCSIK